MSKKAIIFGIRGLKLSKKEKIFFTRFRPWGVILFSRNIKNINQLKVLIKQIKYIFNDKNYPILIDQEGGKVSRINRIIDLSFFSQSFFSELYKSLNFAWLVFKLFIESIKAFAPSCDKTFVNVPVFMFSFILTFD